MNNHPTILISCLVILAICTWQAIIGMPFFELAMLMAALFVVMFIVLVIRGYVIIRVRDDEVHEKMEKMQAELKRLQEKINNNSGNHESI